MTSLTPAAILARALESYDDPQITRLAKRAGVSPANAKRAARGSACRRPGVHDFIRLCAVLGIDPVNGKTRLPWKPADFQSEMLAIAVRMRRKARGDSVREAAEDMGISATIVSRIENANPHSFECVVAACAYARVDPQTYISYTRETVSGNSLTAHDKQGRSAA